MLLFKSIMLLLFLKYAESYSEKQNCLTPDNKNGECILIASCTTMVDFLNTAPKPFTAELKKLILDYVCAFGEGTFNTKICCPSEPIRNRDYYTEDDSPPDVLNHKNIKLLPEDCGIIDINDKIRGGTNAQLGEFPWMAALSYQTDKGQEFKCGGSIINERYILTAAHCIVDTPYPLIGVRVGEYSLLSEKDCDLDVATRCLPPYQDLTIEKNIIHPKYNNSSYANDIALLQVSKMNLEAENIKAVCLPVYEDVIHQEYKRGVVIGWGLTNPYVTQVVDILQKVELNKRDLSVCIEAYKVQPSIKLSNKQICVGGEGIKDSCSGDSGGPFQVAAHFNDEDRYVQRGVVSIGHRVCGTGGFPGVYTDILYYTDWILDNIVP